MTFDDLDFEYDKIDDTFRSRVEFDNGYGASIVKGPRTYGGPAGLYELAVIKNVAVCTDTEITYDVIGWLSPKEIDGLLSKIQELKKEDANA